MTTGSSSGEDYVSTTHVFPRRLTEACTYGSEWQESFLLDRFSPARKRFPVVCRRCPPLGTGAPRYFRHTSKPICTERTKSERRRFNGSRDSGGKHLSHYRKCMEILFPPNCKVVRMYIYIYFFFPTLLSFEIGMKLLYRKSVVNSIER